MSERWTSKIEEIQHKQEKGGKRRAYKKKLGTEKICLYKTTTSPNERKATRTPCRHLPEDDTDTTPPYYHINLLAPYFILPFIYCDGVARRDPHQATGGRLNAVAPPTQGPPEGGSRSKLPFSRPFPPRGSGARRAGVNLQPACTTCFTLLRETLNTKNIAFKTTTSPNERKARSSTIPAVIHNTGCRRPFHTHPFMNQPREPGCPTPAQPVGRSRRGPRALRLGAQALRQERPPRRRQLASCAAAKLFSS